ncbi:MAG: pantoate--beta-alanine ligase [Bacteroidetes bacterium]|nr:pantoate--beta-alanine ligase [Bacteroidota bacterium]
MRIISLKTDLDQVISEYRKSGKRIGFVPTMGALHQGHVSLVEASRKQADVTVCSIFVNPTQFNDKNDLLRYPRTPEQDILMLEQAGCDVLFMPPVEEVYPVPDTRVFDFGYLDKILDGAARPGHFNGVGQVVSILFSMVKPDVAFFGQKDYQQVMIIRELVRQLNLPVEIVPCPILREPDGLAMSSRNTLLSAEERKVAAHVPEFMQKAAQIYHEQDIDQARSYIQEAVSSQALMRLDYYMICDRNTLREIEHKNQPAISLIAVFVGKIRLIDNLFLD